MPPHNQLVPSPPPPSHTPTPTAGTPTSLWNPKKDKQFNARKEENQVHVCLLA